MDINAHLFVFSFRSRTFGESVNHLYYPGNFGFLLCEDICLIK